MDTSPHLIRASDLIPEDLGDIFFHESPVVVEFLMVLEKELGLRIPDSVAELAGRETVTIKEIVNAIYKVLAQKPQA